MTGHAGPVLQPLGEADLAIIADWLRDAKARRRPGGMLPLRSWFDYANAEPGYFVWLAYGGTATAGLVSVETYPDRTASISLLVAPHLRNRGCGKSILSALLTRPELRHLTTIEAGVEPDNSAGLRCGLSAGFVLQRPEPDDEGFLTLVYRFPEPDSP